MNQPADINYMAQIAPITCPHCGKQSGTEHREVGGFRTHIIMCDPAEQARRFWSKVDKNGPNGCWVWTAYCQKFGHGWTKHGLAHRHSWTLLRGPIPDGMFVLHKCHNPPCVNPDHLHLGIRQDNSDDMVRADRQARGERAAQARITDAIARDIKRSFKRYGYGETNIAEIIEKYKDCGITASGIYQCAIGKTWRHIK